jgi:hypothetical protein
MAIHYSDNATKVRPAVYPDEAGKVLVSDGTFEITAAQNLDEVVVALCILPAGCIPIDFTVVVDALDSGNSLVWNGGAIKSTLDDVDQIMISASQVGRVGAPGVVRATLFPVVTAAITETYYGIHVTAQTGGVAGTIRGILQYRSEEYGV